MVLKKKQTAGHFHSLGFQKKSRVLFFRTAVFKASGLTRKPQSTGNCFYEIPFSTVFFLERKGFFFSNILKSICFFPERKTLFLPFSRQFGQSIA